MSCTTRPLLAHQQRALAAAAGLVGRPRLRAGLALTLAFACGPALDEPEPGTTGDPALTDAASTLAPETGTDAVASSEGPTTGASTGVTTTGDSSTGEVTTGTGGGTLLTDASTTLASTGSTDTGDSSTGDSSTGELDDCILDRRTMEVDWACCEAQDWLPFPQCTPWGPPAPPAADRLLRARAARRVLA